MSSSLAMLSSTVGAFLVASGVLREQKGLSGGAYFIAAWVSGILTSVLYEIPFPKIIVVVLGNAALCYLGLLFGRWLKELEDKKRR